MKTALIIRKAKIEDAKIIITLNKKFFHEEGRRWNELISSRHSEVFVLELNKKIIGFTGLQYYNWNNTARVIDIFVHPNYRNKDYGTKLIKFLIGHLKKKKYRALIAEAPSLNPVLTLYLKNGFRVCGFNDRYYSNRGKEIALFLSYDM